MMYSITFADISDTFVLSLVCENRVIGPHLLYNNEIAALSSAQAIRKHERSSQDGALLLLNNMLDIYNMISICLSQSTFLHEALTATASSPFSLLPREQLSTVPLTYVL